MEAYKLGARWRMVSQVRVGPRREMMAWDWEMAVERDF
jgi:hypothetical protein